jgi:hypothetical protein
MSHTDSQKAAIKLLFKTIKLNKTKPDEINTILTTNNLNINVLNGWKETLLYNCAKHSVNIPMLDWLFTQGCDITIINKLGLNAYDGCIRWNRKKGVDTVLTWLSSKGITFKKEYPNLPEIHNIIICYPDNYIYKWAKGRYNINEQDVNGNTPLHISCDQSTEHNSPLPCKWLCDNGADVNVQNNNGMTAIHLAAISGFSTCIQQMVKAKGNISIKDKNGKTALDLAKIAQTSAQLNKWPGDFKETIDLLEK